jgi:hypothetical protein
MNTSMQSTLLLAAAVAALGACAVPTAAAVDEERLKQLTASVVSEAGDVKDIAISDFRSFPAKREWRARIGDMIYVCDADEQLNLPQCRALDPASASG